MRIIERIVTTIVMLLTLWVQFTSALVMTAVGLMNFSFEVAFGLMFMAIPIVLLVGAFRESLTIGVVTSIVCVAVLIWTLLVGFPESPAEEVQVRRGRRVTTEHRTSQATSSSVRPVSRVKRRYK
jgi:hypothetical protein